MFTTRIGIIFIPFFPPLNMTKVIAAAIGAPPAQRSMERDHARGADPKAVAMRRKRKEEWKTRSLLRTRMPMSPRKKKTKSSERAATFAQPPKLNVTAKNPVARTVRREGKL